MVPSRLLPGLSALFCALPVLAHDLWLEQEQGELVLYEGHRHSSHAGADSIAYAPGFVREALCLDATGRTRGLAVGKTAPWRTGETCATLRVAVSSGYWSKTPWETVNKPRDQVPGVIKSWLSEESVKRIERWAAGADRPLGSGLEITPAGDPLAIRPGSKLVVLVTEDGQPRAGVPVAYGEDTRGVTGEDGRIAIRLRHGGIQLISASVDTPLTDGKADRRIRSASLQFDLPQ